MIIRKLDGFHTLQEAGFVSLLQQMYFELFGEEHPPTGKESTTPDTALLHPTLSDLLLSILVDKQGFFDTHSPVIFRLQVPSQQICRKTFRYPSTWISLRVDQDDIERVLPFTIGKNGIPTALEEWGNFSEDLVENALQGNTSPMDGMGYASAHISNANLCLFDPCLVFPAGDMNKISRKLRLYPPINLHTVDGRNPLKTFEKWLAGFLPSTLVAGRFPLLLIEGYSEMFRRLSPWLTLQFLRIIDLPGKPKCKFFFHGPLVESVQFNL